ncbi:MAG: HDOD domain-containing protein [Desulfuromonadaceae bacterium]|nr:HDOD domain-containing protein [Desulfuromonadaceae bacterium]
MLRIPDEIIASIEAMHLPTIPQTLLRFMQMADDENTTMAELAAFAGHDPVLTARVLSVANSPALKGRGESKDLAHALAIIGTRFTRTLAACLVVQNVFLPACDNHDFDFTGFWGHSLRVAEVAQAIAVEIHFRDVGEAHLAGLLHNIGQLLLLGGLRGRYGVLLAASAGESALRDREKIELGTNHSAVGAWLVDQWALSSFMADAILFHHAAADEIVAADTLSQIVWSAHTICHHCAESDSLQQERDADFASVHAMLGVDVPTIFTLYQNCAIRVACFAATLGITEFVNARTLPYSPTPSLDSSRAPLNSSESANAQMAETVRNLAMMQPLQRLYASLQSEAEMLFSIRESAWLLFGPGHCAFLMVSRQEAVLSGVTVSGQPLLLQQIKIPLDPGQSLAAAVALGKKPTAATFEQEDIAAASLADIQINRILGSEGLLYIPLKGRTRIIGLMVYGVSASHYVRLKMKLSLMTSFAGVAATSLEEWCEKQEREQLLTAKLINNFDLHARKDTAIVSHVEVNTLIESMLERYGDSLFTSRGIKIEKDLEAGLSAVACDRDTIKQILFHLWHNASDATAAGGFFAISTHDNINQDGRSCIEIRLSDTGPGMPQEVMRRLFQPLAPDYNRSGHVGLGLSIVAALVEQIDGRITCQSKSGRGTRFSILLPKIGNMLI